MKFNLTAHISAFFLSLLVVACGGGSSGSNSAPNATYSDQVRVSTNMAANAWSSYQTASSLANFDDRCLLGAASVQYPKEFMGNLPYVSLEGTGPTGQSLKNIPLGLSIKDNWSHGTPNPNQNSGCGTSNRDAFVLALQRAKSIGATYATVANYVCLANADLPDQDWWSSPEIAISKTDLLWMSEQARAQGMKLRLMTQVCPQDGLGQRLTSKVSAAWLERFFNGYKAWIVEHGRVLQGSQFEAISADWGDWNPDWTAEYAEIRERGLADVIQGLRTAYSGKLYQSSLWGSWQNIQNITSKVDYVQLMIQSPWNLTSSQKANPSLADMKTGYRSSIEWLNGLVGSTTPVQFWLQIQSHKKFLDVGWVEDSGCWKPYTSVCYGEQGVTTDFGLQALLTQAALEVIREQRSVQVESVSGGGFWLGDNLAPKESFPNISQSIRNKPAEFIVYKWWKS